MKGEFWVSLKGIIGGTPQEVVMKAALAVVTLAVSVIKSISIFAILFLGVLVIDAVLGTLLARQKGEPIKPQRWITGPMMKGIVLILFLCMAAIFDMIIGMTPVRHMGESPLLVSASMVGIGAVVWEGAGKVQRLTGLRVTEWLNTFFDRFRKPSGQ